MKNQYVGDINDYGKYIILKALNDAGLHLAICWMLTPPDERGDGRKISYLNADRYRNYSPLIYDTLKSIVTSGNRNVEAIQNANMFPMAQYCNQSSGLPDCNSIDLIFLDPDNGFEVKTTKKGGRGSERYLFWDTVLQLYGKGVSLLVYQHFPRVSRVEFVKKLNGEIERRIGTRLTGHIYTGNVDFVVIAQDKHRREITDAINEINIPDGNKVVNVLMGY